MAHCIVAIFGLLIHLEGQVRLQPKLDLLCCSLSHAISVAAGWPWLTVAQAFDQLEAALQDTCDWVGKVERVQELISGIEQHRDLHSRCSCLCSSSFHHQGCCIALQIRRRAQSFQLALRCIH